MNRSDSITNFAASFSKAQAAIKGAIKDAVNPGFKSEYATLDANLEACRQPLTSHGLSVLQFPSTVENAVSVTTVLLHDSGEWVQSDLLTVRAKDASPQAVGSAITYLRRYQLAALVGIAPKDDDAEGAQQKPRGVSEPTGYTVAAPPVPHAAIPPRNGREASDPKAGGSGVSAAYGTTQHGEEIPDDGRLYIARVDLTPTKKPGITKALVTFSDGKQASTIKDKLIAFCEQLCQDRTPVELWADDVEETRWGLNLLNVRKAEPEMPAFEEFIPPDDGEAF